VDTAAAGGFVSGEYRLNTVFALGLKAGVFFAFDSALTIEPLAFLRYYSIHLGPGQFVFKAEAGAALFWDGGMPGDADVQMDPYLSGGLGAAYRIVFDRWYIEPYVRTGYPVILGGGIGAGVLF
jgi:hypothetical protein